MGQNHIHIPILMLENEGTLYIECQTSLPNNNCQLMFWPKDAAVLNLEPF